MDDPRDDQMTNPDEGALLAAYLAADTDEVTTARIERRLRDEPEFAARLDALARTRVRLQRLDQVAPPPELHERLVAAIQAERTATTDDRAGMREAVSARATHAATPPRAAQRTRRLAGLSAAAVWLLFAVVAGGVLVGLFLPRGSSDGAESTGAAEVEDGGVAAAQADKPVEGLAAPDSAPEAAQGDERDDGAQGEAEAADEAGVATRAGSSEAAMAAPPGGSLPPVSDDAEITTRLADAVGTGAVSQREARLRRGADLPTQPACLSGTDAIAVDLVERDGRALLTALVARDSGRAVVLFDPVTCERVRSFTP